MKRMADIYSKAGRVLIWLGPESDDSDIAIDCIEEISSNIEVNWTLYTIRSTTDVTVSVTFLKKDLPFFAVSRALTHALARRECHTATTTSNV